MIRRMRLTYLIYACGLMISCNAVHASPQATDRFGRTMIRPGSRTVNLNAVRQLKPRVTQTALPGPTTLMAPVTDDEPIGAASTFHPPLVNGSVANGALKAAHGNGVDPVTAGHAPTATIGDLATPMAPVLPNPFADPPGQFNGPQMDSNGSIGSLMSPFPNQNSATYDQQGFVPNSPDGNSETFYSGPIFQHGSGLELLTPYMTRVKSYQHDSSPMQVKPAPKAYVPWWTVKMLKPVRTGSSPLPVTLDQLTVEALQYSPQVQAIRVDPQIREQTVIAEDAEFDWAAFVDTTWDDTSDPVGSSLTTGVGGPSRFRDHQFGTTAGLRKRTLSGGELEISQRFGFQDNNSQFFLPSQQGTAKLALNYTRPLLRESGRVYNQSRIVIARLEQGVSEDQLVEDLQLHLLDVSQAFWQLYRARAVYLQKTKLLESAQTIQDMLEGRQMVDSVRRQVLRSRAAVASRKAEIARASMEIRNSESRLRQLVNHPSLISANHVEMLPNATPVAHQVPFTMSESLEIALQNRPDIAQAIKTMRAISVRLGVARKDLLPKLDLVFGAYLSGLEGGSDVNLAWGNQFTEGEPSVSLGLLFEVPLGNRAAKARAKRRELELHQALQEFKATVEGGITDVEISVREADTTFKEVQSRYHSMRAAEKEADYLSERWKLLPGSDRTTSFLLEDLLDAQERTAQEQLDYVTAQVNYMLSIADVKRATGTLLQSPSNVQYAQNNEVPTQSLPTDSTPLPLEGNNTPFQSP